jgi:hypothetical protein
MRLTSMLVFAALLLVPCVGEADIPATMSYQGVLRDDVGNVVPDDDYDFTFEIYDVATGGTRLWYENQTLPVEGGIFNAYLGTVTPLSSLAFDVPYWLAISVEGEAELTPRIPLASVPYAAHAGSADTCLEGDNDWTIDGDDVYHYDGLVGVGTANPQVKLDVDSRNQPCARFENDAGTNSFTVRGVNNGGTAGAFFTFDTVTSYPSIAAAVYGKAGLSYRGGHFAADSGDGIFAFSNTGRAVYGYTNSGYSGYFAGGVGLYVDDMLETNGLTMPTGAASGHVLTSDASGVGTWQAPAAASDGDWTISGDDVYHDVGYVGIGTAAPAVPLDVLAGAETCARFENDAGTSDFTVQGVNLTGTAGAFFSGTTPPGYPGVPAAVYGYASSAQRGGHFSSSGHDGLYTFSNNSKAIYAKSNSGYSGYFEGGVGLYCDDMVETAEFKMATGASDGHVLTSDGSGVGTWQAPVAVSDGDWYTTGFDMYSQAPGLVGVGTSLPSAKLTVSAPGHGTTTQVLNVATETDAAEAVEFKRTSTPASADDLLALDLPSGAPDDCQFIEAERGSDITFAVDADGSITADGKLTVSGSELVQAEFQSDYLSGSTKIVSAASTATGTGDVVAIYGESKPSDGYGYGGLFKGGYRGIHASVDPTGGAFDLVGVFGEVYAGGGSHSYGVQGRATGAQWAVGVYGSALGGSIVNYAGYFNGDVHASGTLTAGTKSFKIDHPLDPENKYLVHSCVESDDMMNIYNGNVVLDARGEAWVEMPEWFEALNQDFRYQLTAIGAPGPNLYIAEEISGGRLMIAGGEPGSKVSWQVTGVRHDPLAEARRMTVEVDKRPDEIGKYMHPEAYGKPVTMGVDYHEEREIDTDDSSAGRARRERQESE